MGVFLIVFVIKNPRVTWLGCVLIVLKMVTFNLKVMSLGTALALFMGIDTKMIFNQRELSHISVSKTKDTWCFCLLVKYVSGFLMSSRKYWSDLMKTEQGLEIQMAVYVNLYISKDNWSSKTWAAFTVSSQKSDWHILCSKYLWAILLRANIINHPGE